MYFCLTKSQIGKNNWTMLDSGKEDDVLTLKRGKSVVRTLGR
jgi:hypothetical protein